jgi:hypothetical protein
MQADTVLPQPKMTTTGLADQNEPWRRKPIC